MILTEDVNESYIQIAFIATNQKNRILLQVIKKQTYNISNKIYEQDMLSITGPGCFGKIYQNYCNKDNIIVLYKQHEDGYIRYKNSVFKFTA